jgi:tyrosinase
LLKSSFREAKPENLDNFIKTRNKAQFSFADKESPDKFIIEIESVKIDKVPEGVVEVYLNLGPNEAPNPKSKSFVGLLDLFSATHAASHHKMADNNKIELNASKAANALGLRIADLKKAEVSFFVRGNNLRGQEISTTSNIRVEGINFAVEIAQK